MRHARTTGSLATQPLRDTAADLSRRRVGDFHLAPDGNSARAVHLGADTRPAAESVGHARDADGRLEMGTRRSVTRHPQAGVANGERRVPCGGEVHALDDEVPAMPARRESGIDCSLGVGDGARTHQRDRMTVTHPREMPGPLAVAVACDPAVDDAHTVSCLRRVARRRRDVQADDMAHQQTDLGSTPIPCSASA